VAIALRLHPGGPQRSGLVGDTVTSTRPRPGTSGTAFCFDRYEPIDFYTANCAAWKPAHPQSWAELQQAGHETFDRQWQRSAPGYDPCTRYL